MIKQILSRAPTPHADTWHSPDPWVRFGSRTVSGLVLVLLALSLVFSVSGAIVASGTVTVQGAYQTVQNADGGVVRNILVKNGDLVKRDQVLVELDDTESRTSFNVSQDRINELSIQSARLKAELNGTSDFSLPAIVSARAQEPTTLAMIASQRALFKARTNALDGQRNVLKNQINQQQSLLSGLHAQYIARAKETRLADQQLSGIRSLYAKGYANKTQLTSAARDSARLGGDLGRLQSDVARTQTGIAEAKLRLAQLQKQHTQEIVEELRRVSTALSELQETAKAQKSRLSRNRLRAPLTGYVHALAVHTLGGVLAAGAPVLQIIPTGKKLIIEARVKPTDIDNIQTGQHATIRLPALNARRTPQLKGSVISVSPAQIKDPRQGDHFTVQISLPQSEIAKIGKGQRLIPGMPAEVFIETSPRSVMSYFLKPLTDAVSYAMREE